MGVSFVLAPPTGSAPCEHLRAVKIPETHYARSGDIAIAYQVFGAGQLCAAAGPHRRGRRGDRPRRRAEARRSGVRAPGWYIRHVALDSKRSSTWTTGHGVARMVAALAGGSEELWPASVVLDGEYGIEEIALTAGRL